tara:strand:+ start:218 stop:1303 length:1086 start_codon:yes stop_codon:yes gene_type:complete
MFHQRKNKFKYLYYFLIIIYLVLLDVCLTNIYKYGKNYLIGDLRINHPNFHHTLRSNAEGGGFISEKYYTNSLGFRDFLIRDIEKIKNNKKRILLMGDSSTMGLFNEYEDSYAGKITKHFEKKNIEVLNASVTSYSPIIYFKKLEHLIKKEKLEFNNLFLFIDISDTFDDVYRYRLNNLGDVIDPKTTFDNTNYVDDVKKLIISHSTFFFFILDTVNDIFYPDTDNSFFAINHQNNLWNIDDDVFNEYGKKGLKLNILYINKIKTLLESKNIDLKIIIYPWPGTIYYYDKKTPYEKNWEDWSQQNDVQIYNFVNHFDYVKNLSKQDRLTIIDKYYHKLDMHFNAAGSDLFFKSIIGFLEEN